MLEGLTLERHRDLRGRRWHVWVRRGLLGVVVLVLVLALADQFGQGEVTSEVGAAGVGLQLQAPTRVRGGLLYQAKLTVTARNGLKDARLILAPGWSDGFQMNTIEPSPVGEASANGRLSFDLGHVPAGEKHVLWLQFQVDPTAVGRRNHDVSLYDGDRYLMTVHRDVVVLP